MTRSAAITVPQYLKELPKERRAVVSAVRAAIRRSLPAGYQETMNWGMICYGIPLERYPNTYNGQRLSYVALATQKNYYALYLMGPYIDPVQLKQLKDGFKKAGKKLDMGKSCLRFRALEDLPLDVIERAVASMPPEDLIARCEASHRPRQKGA